MDDIWVIASLYHGLNQVNYELRMVISESEILIYAANYTYHDHVRYY